MKKLMINEIREKYLVFFEGKEHLRLSSYSLVPEHDKSLLLINAGMAPLKTYFTGQETPPKKRVTTCQKCVRTCDIEEVGKTARHLTFFEMLGNFSFGDYFKEETIAWAWEFMTNILGFPAEKLYVSVYLDDDEAYDIWNKKIGIPTGRICRMGKEDNFWELSLGPCGPCSEIYFDRGPEFGKDDFEASVTSGEDRFIEVWNLVFTQFNKDEEGNYSDLANPNIDTGMGLERMAMVMQGVDSVFDIDNIKAIRDEVCKLSGVSYGTNDKKDISIRIVTEHIRSTSFMISDNIQPTGEGRGYVLRRLLRRAARHGKLLGIEGRFLAKLSSVVIENSKEAYPELAEKKDHILRLMDQEEQRFYETLDTGMESLKTKIETLKAEGKKILAGSEAFKLHDTFGFPLELTKEILEEEDFTVDEDGFKEEMERQRSRARAAREDGGFTGTEGSVYDKLNLAAAEFVGYTHHSIDDAEILYIDDISIITDKTPVYAEKGGQKADEAVLITESGKAVISDCLPIANGQFAHIAKERTGSIKQGQKAAITINSDKRLKIARHHSATHLMHKALRDVLGSHVQQAGSMVAANRLRFDFNHFAPVSAEELAKIEAMVNDAVLRDLPIETNEMSINDAKAKGAIALFGEKYGETVRVVDMGGESIELCGGTHLKSTAQIGSFKIVSEGGVSAGVRRIEAIVGETALAYYRNTEEKLAEISAFLKTPEGNLINRIEQLINTAKEAEKELSKIRQKDANSAVDEIFAKREQVNGMFLASATLQNMGMEALRNLSDSLMDKMGQGIVLLAGIEGDKANILAKASEDAVKAGVHCGNVVKAAATAAGGGGGGRPNMAQAGIKDVGKVEAAMEAAKGQLLT